MSSSRCGDSGQEQEFWRCLAHFARWHVWQRKRNVSNMVQDLGGVWPLDMGHGNRVRGRCGWAFGNRAEPRSQRIGWSFTLTEKETAMHSFTFASHAARLLVGLVV